MVWGAPTPCSSGGRSAVHTSRGTLASWASTTAGCSSTAAVPLVHSTTAGRPVAIPSPSARKPADRSSWCTWSRTPPVGGQRQRHRRRARAGRHHRVGQSRPDPLVDERRAERGGGRLRRFGAGHARQPRLRGATSSATPHRRRHHRSPADRPAARRPPRLSRRAEARPGSGGGRARLHPDLGVLVAHRRPLWPPTTSWCWSTHRATAPRPGVELDLWGAGRAVAEAGGAGTYLGYSMGGRICLHAALARPERGRPAGADQRHRRTRRPRRPGDAAGPPTSGWPTTCWPSAWRPSWTSGWPSRCSPRLDPEQAHRRARLANTAAGLASSLRLAGTGTQEPLWDRLSELTMPVLVVAGSPRRQVRGAGRAAGHGHRWQRRGGRDPRRRPHRPPGAARHLPRRPRPLAGPHPLTRVPNPRGGTCATERVRTCRPGSGGAVSAAGGGDEQADRQQDAVDQLHPAGPGQHGDQAGSLGPLQHDEDGLLGQEDGGEGEHGPRPVGQAGDDRAPAGRG